MENFEVKRYYEWISGGRQGKIEVYQAEDENNVYFESGRIIPKDQLEIQLRQSDESSYLARGGESQFIQQIPQVTGPSFEEWEKMLGNDEPTPSIQPQTIQKQEKSPIQIILEKQKKLVDVELDITMPLKLPSDKAIEFMSMMFDEDEVIDEICNFVYSQVSSEEINSIIKNSIRERISSISKLPEE
jgi:hypothetical protein